MKYSMGRIIALCCIICLGASFCPQSFGAENRAGVGVHFFQTTDSLDGPYDETGVSWLLSYQRLLSEVWRVQADLKFFHDGYAGSRSDVGSPEVLLLFGSSVYAGAGLGILYSHGDFADDPFAILRAGYEHALSELYSLDVNLNYRFSQWDGISEFGIGQESDTVTLGFALRRAF